MIADARDDPGIRGVLLDVDSPGGEVGGLFDLADEVYARPRVRSRVTPSPTTMRSPLRTHLASSAQRLFVTRTGGVGSVGVIAVHMDQSGWDEKMGRKYTAIYAGARKNDFSTHQPLSDGARANLQGEVDRLYEMFVASVARNRGMTPALVRKTDAGLYWGEKAISAGLADQVGSFDDALAAVTQASPRVETSSRNGVCRGANRRRGEEHYGSTHRNETGRRSGPRRRARRNETCGGAGSAAPAAAPPAPEPAAAPAAAPVVDAAAIEARIRAEHEEIAALCTLAGEPGFVAEAIAKRMTRRAGSRGACSRARPRSRRARRSSRRWMASPVGAEAQLNAAATQTRGAASTSRSRRRTWRRMKAQPRIFTRSTSLRSRPR